MAELIFKFDSPSELEEWLQIFKKYGLENKLSPKSSKIKKSGDEPAEQTPQRNWSTLGIGNLKGALNDIPNLRDYAYED